jgi:deoxyribodipyrimidine photo-lyase
VTAPAVAGPVQVVWFKRDLRLHDHAPLREAASRGPVLPVYVWEPELLRSAEYDAAHGVFVADCLGELRDGLAARGLPLCVLRADLPDAFEALWRAQPFAALWSHEETGQWITFQRDLRVAAWCRERGVAWTEIPQNGVIRRLRSRDGWARRWDQRMLAAESPPLGAGEARAAALPELPEVLRAGVEPPLADTGPSARPRMQRGGEARALRALRGFLTERGVDYRRAMSSPVSAFKACSRISPHLTWGSLSMRRAAHAAEDRAAQLRALDAAGVGVDPRWVGSVASFAGRLRWHCHFMQKLEDEPRIEFENFSRAFDGLREDAFDEDRFAAWCEGRTGFPMVDACMRALLAGGWINFRMRAMLMSFAAYQLWLHWRRPAQHLARLFLDFEPGIHYSQCQMQSGTTGINTIRIYSPIKQALDQDPDGSFIREWLPELEAVPVAHLAAPWEIPSGLQQMLGVVIGRDYPAPIVDPAGSYAEARRRIGAARGTGTARAEADRVQRRHGSRRSGLPQSTSRSKR